MSDPSGPVLGQTDAPIDIDGSALLADVALALAGQCRRHLDIVSRHLDPAVYDNDDFAAAVKQLALGNRHARIRLFIVDPRPLVSRGHRLLDLAERLPSFVHVRVAAPPQKEFNEAILLADRKGYVHRRFADRFEGTANFNDPRLAAALADRIDELWERGQPDPNFRRLHL
ncbi:MAG: acyltransferase [Gammaproteobacteria bacterium]